MQANIMRQAAKQLLKHRDSLENKLIIPEYAGTFHQTVLAFGRQQTAMDGNSNQLIVLSKGWKGLIAIQQIEKQGGVE